MYKKFLDNLSSEAKRIYETIVSQYNFDKGDEFEFALCQFLRVVLPNKYSICRGVIVDKNDTYSQGDDIIIYDGNLFPRLRLIDDNFAIKQYVPYEAVYAYIEVKHKIDFNEKKPEKGSQNLKKAFEQCSNIKNLVRDKKLLSETEIGDFSSSICIQSPNGWPEFRNSMYTGIISRYTDKMTSVDLANLITDIGKGCNNFPDLIIADNFVCLPTIDDSFESPFVIPGKTSRLNVIESDSSIGIGICSLLLALNHIQLKPINYKTLMAEAINKSYM